MIRDALAQPLPRTEALKTLRVMYGKRTFALIEPIIDKIDPLISTDIAKLETGIDPLAPPVATPVQESSPVDEPALEERVSNDNGNLRTRIERLERFAIDEALRRERGNVSRAAEHLGLDRDTLHTKIKKYNLKELQDALITRYGDPLTLARRRRWATPEQ